MRFRSLIVAAYATVATCNVAAAAPASAPGATPSGSSVTSYPPSFFAGVRPNTALDMVNALPGFSLDTGAGVRGFGGAAGNVLIDGDRPATKNDALDEILKRIPAGEVLRIDLIRGGAPGVDMQGKTVIANVIRRADGHLHLTTVLVGTESYNGHGDWGMRLEGTKRFGPAAFEGSVLITTNADDGTGDGPHTVRTPANLVTEQDLIHYFGDAGTDKATAAVETPLLGGRLRVEGSYIHNPYFSRDDDLSPLAADRQTEIYTQDQDTGEAGVRYVRSLLPGVSLEVYGLQQLSRYAEDDDLAQPGGVTTFALGKRQGESILRSIATLTPDPALTVHAGVEGDYNWQTSHTLETSGSQVLVVPAANVRVTETRGEAFADATWRALPSLTLEGGVRVEASRIASTGDVISSERFLFPKPRFVATWSPDGDNQLQLRAEREVGQLDFADFAAQGTLGQGEHAGNPNLTPQQDWVVEGAFDHHFWKAADASVTLRHYWLQDVIDDAGICAPQDLIPGTGQCNPADEFAAPANIGAGTKDELAVALTLPTDRLWLKNGLLVVRATWRRSRVIDPATHQPREISNLHPVDSEIHFTQGLPQWKSTWAFDIFPAWRQTQYLFDEVDTQRLGLWVDVYYEYKPRPDLSIKLEADNLASHGMEQIRAFYDPFRDVGGGLLSSIDTRSPRYGPELTLRLRKTFG